MNDQENARLQEQYPEWHIRRSEKLNCIMATRLGRPLSARELHYGLCATLVEDDYETLAEVLAQQRKIEEGL